MRSKLISILKSRLSIYILTTSILSSCTQASESSIYKQCLRDYDDDYSYALCFGPISTEKEQSEMLCCISPGHLYEMMEDPDISELSFRSTVAYHCQKKTPITVSSKVYESLCEYTVKRVEDIESIYSKTGISGILNELSKKQIKEWALYYEDSFRAIASKCWEEGIYFKAERSCEVGAYIWEIYGNAKYLDHYKPKHPEEWQYILPMNSSN